uniref:Uncharacterized protein n=1 Tax=Opuntia streptacantha TaxID=393608 RepID=A0A7C9ALD0_OPUST
MPGLFTDFWLQHCIIDFADLKPLLTTPGSNLIRFRGSHPILSKEFQHRRSNKSNFYFELLSVQIISVRLNSPTKEKKLSNYKLRSFLSFSSVQGNSSWRSFM